MPHIYDNLPGLMLVCGLLIVGCVLSSKLSSRFSMPGLLVFLLIGMGLHLAVASLAGGLESITDQLPWRHANLIGTVALAFILFSGGLDSSWKEIRGVLRTGTLLSTAGVLLTTLLLGGFASLVATLAGRPDLWPHCLLFGAIISSTDASAVFSILRGRRIGLKGDLKPLLEYESGSNDPMATFLTLFFLELCTAQGAGAVGREALLFLPRFLYQMGGGVLAGLLVARCAVWLFNHLRLDYDGLYYVLGVAVVFLTYSLAACLGANGFMAAYAGGVCMGAHRFVFRNSFSRFADALGWLMQVVLFTILGFMANPRVIGSHWWLGLLMGAFLMLVARPLATWLCMAGSGFSSRAKCLISWVGLRGGAPIMLATFPMLLAPRQETALVGGTNVCELTFNLVFCMVLLSVVLQSFTIMPLARLLKLDFPFQNSPTGPISFDQVSVQAPSGGTAGEANPDDLACNEPAVYRIHPHTPADGKSIRALSLPKGVFIVMIARKGQWLAPRGDTLLRAEDELTVLATPANQRLAAAFFAPAQPEEPPQDPGKPREA